MKQVIVKSVPEELHREFKTFCASKGITMSGVIKEFMQQKKSILIEADKRKLDVIIRNLQFIMHKNINKDEKKSDITMSKSYINMLINNLETIGTHKTISRWGR